MPAASRATALALAAALCASLGPASARAEEGPRPIRWEPRRDLALTGAALALWFGSELAKDQLAPAACRFCGTNALDAGARDALLWSDPTPARHTSDLLGGVLLPGAVAAHQLLAARDAGAAREGLVDVLVVAQAVALAGNVNQLVKFAVGRQRPFVRYGDGSSRPPDSDDDLSFYSSHTSVAFSVVAAAGTVSSLRGYRSAPWVWGVGLPLAASVGWLRVAADKHYLTDVLTGALVGTAFGVAVPRLLHGREEADEEDGGARVSLVPIPLGVHVVF